MENQNKPAGVRNYLHANYDMYDPNLRRVLYLD